MRLLPANEGFPLGVPGCICYTCNCPPQPGDTYVIDWEIEIVDEGMLMQCEGCIRNVVGMFGYTSPSETARLRGRVRNLEDQIVDLERDKDNRIAKLTEALADN